jgi:TIR domain/Pentapeptide repeats (8 copies)
MANPEHLAILKQGVETWNKWRKINSPIRPDLKDVDLRETYLVDADLREVNFSNARFGDANLNTALLGGAFLEFVDFREAFLVGADLTKAYLREANLRRAILNSAHLNGARLNGTILSEASLNQADFGDATLGYTTLANVDLSNVKGLETVNHLAPSSVAIDTIYLSRGIIPEIFLRGCGVPETFITYSRSLVGQPISFYSCFISHSAKDKRFCERLYADLQAKGVRVWYFPEDAKWGETVWGEIDRSINMYDKLIVVCSENSLQSSPVNREIERALIREDKESKGILFPIRIDDHIFDTWEHERKADVLRKVVGDFSGWDKDAAKYDKAFDKLLKGLQAGA